MVIQSHYLRRRLVSVVPVDSRLEISSLSKLIKRGGTLVLRKSPSHRESKEEEKDECSEADEIESLSDSDEERYQDEKSLKKKTRTFLPYPSRIDMASLWELT
ncbi:hypothetical protein Bca52824_042355 [Brassica carinata]|uniref:Uncharacterized protein n=1 Tax=Brassica carinata TaxID=52824 RepID=A0A8X7V0U6_BRACI|nr:hypothetical protein Bca52824_042355 [Brassica carinata]